MKKILFVMNNLNVGGAEKALVSLLQEIDHSQYEVDLFLFSHKGLFLRQLPPQVNLLPEPENYRYFDMSVKKAVVENLKKGNVKTALARIGYGLAIKAAKVRTQKAQKGWKWLRLALPSLPKNYDAAIGYLENEPNYFCVDKVKSRVKIGFIHNDYNKLQLLPELDLPYFKKLDRVFTISEQCENILKENFPSLSGKFSIMYNIVSPKALRQLAVELTDFPKKGITLVSVGRLNPQKGFDMAVDACKILVDAGRDVYWHILGEGEDRAMLESKIADAGLKGRFLLPGISENPYPIVAAADIYVQPSRFEGKSIAIDEAKILGKPIVVTDFPSVVDQITHGENGWIVETNPESIASGIAKLIDDAALRETLSLNLSRENLGTEREIDKLYAAMNQS